MLWGTTWGNTWVSQEADGEQGTVGKKEPLLQFLGKER